VPETDVLVVDSTYGSPNSTRTYKRDEVDSIFLDIVTSKLKEGPIHLKAFRGTLQRALQLLHDSLREVPIVASPRLCSEIEVYHRYGYAIDEVCSLLSPEGKEALASRRFIRLYGKGDGEVFGVTEGTSLTLSAYMTSTKDPLLEYSPRAFRLAMSGHADFEDTLRYIAATKASFVITDSSRSAHAAELAMAVKARLGIEAAPARHVHSSMWGT
jgi:putative mRNA 3-end processing factor